MHTNLVLPNNEIIKIRVDIMMNINSLKNEIRRFYNINEEIDLSIDGFDLIDDVTLHESHIWPDSKIVLRLKKYNIFNPNAPVFIY